MRDIKKFVLGGVLCLTFCFRVCWLYSEQLPDPPELLAPEKGAVITDSAPQFFWTSVPRIPGHQKFYELTIVKIMPGQTPAHALEANKPHHQKLMRREGYIYPDDAFSLEKGEKYAWQVQVVDEKHRPAALNNGYSEIFTFSINPPAPVYTPVTITTSPLKMTGYRIRPYQQQISTSTLKMTGYRQREFIRQIQTASLKMTGYRVREYLRQVGTSPLKMTGYRKRPYLQQMTTNSLKMTGYRNFNEEKSTNPRLLEKIQKKRKSGSDPNQLQLPSQESPPDPEKTKIDTTGMSGLDTTAIVPVSPVNKLLKRIKSNSEQNQQNKN